MSRVLAIPSPVAGWDAKNALADMPEDRASILDNWFPREGRVDVRPGYISYATGLEGNVETLAEFINGANRKFIACANSKIWNITAGGAASDITNSMTITMNRWQTANMDSKMGLVNGTDAPLEIASDGTTVSTMTLSGPTAANVIGINVFNGRSYFWEDDSQSFWYSAVNTLGGTVTEFPLGRVGSFGGKLLTMGTWTRDGGDGSDDFAVFFMDSGDTIVYQGSDPATFSLVGVFKLAPLVARRGVIKLGGDLIAITRDGYISLQGAIDQGRVTERGILSDQINPAVADACNDYGGNFGWQAFHYPRGNMLIFNVPVATDTTYEQHVFNTHTGSPCRFKNIAARCWGIYSDKAYFGGTGVVYLFDSGNDDNGNNIDADALPAPTYLGSRENQKLLTAIQPNLLSDGAIAISTAVGADFAVPTVGYAEPSFVGDSSSWDVAEWDTASWSDGNDLTKLTVTTSGPESEQGLRGSWSNGTQSITCLNLVALYDCSATTP